MYHYKSGATLNNLVQKEFNTGTRGQAQERSEAGKEREREIFIQRIQRFIPKSMWKDLEKFGSTEVPDERVTAIKKAILNATGLASLTTQDISLLTQTDSAIWPGKILRLSITAKQGDVFRAVPVEINCSEGFIKVNGVDVQPAKLASTLQREIQSIAEGRDVSHTLNGLLSKLQSKSEYPYLGMIQGSNEILVISSSRLAQPSVYNSFQCWKGSFERGKSSLLESLKVGPVKRDASGSLIIEGVSSKNERFNIKVDARVGAIFLNGQKVIDAPRPTNTKIIPGILDEGRNIESYKKFLSEYKAHGVSIHPEKRIDADVEKTDLLGVANHFDESVRQTRARNPLVAAQIGQVVTKNIFSAPGIHQSISTDAMTGKTLQDTKLGSAIEVGTFSLKSYPIGSTKAVAEVWDYLRGGVKTFEFDTANESEVKKVAKAVQAYVAKTYSASEYEDILKRIIKDPKLSSTFNVDIDKGGQEKSTFKEIFTAFPKSQLHITFAPAEFSEDYLSTGGVDEDLIPFLERSVTMTKDSLKALDTKGIAVNGKVKSLMFSVPIDLKSHKLSFDHENRLTHIDGRSTVEHYIDRYGNRVEISIVAQPDSKDLHKILYASRQYAVTPAPALQSTSNYDFEPLKIELKEIGRLNGIRQLPYRREGVLKGVTVYSSDKNFTFDDTDLKEAATRFINGMQHAENLFGTERGKGLTELVIRDSSEFNAYADELAPKACMIDISRLEWEQKSGGQVELIGIHEAVHSLDHQSRLRLSGGAFKSAFERINQDEKLSIFLSRVNEDSFLSGLSLAGHAEDNEKELLASLVNSLQSDTWTAKVQSETKSFRRGYQIALEALGENLSQLAKENFLPANAPIISLVQQRLSELKSL